MSHAVGHGAHAPTCNDGVVIDIDGAIATLSLDEKCRLLAGDTNWRTRAYPDVGIPQLKMSDGPTGLRGEGLGAAGTPGVTSSPVSRKLPRR